MTTSYATLVTPRPRPRLRARLAVQREAATDVGARDELAELDFVLNVHTYVVTQ